MAEKSKIEKFEEMLRSSFRTASQDMYLDLLRAWMTLDFMRTVTAAELAGQMVKEPGHDSRHNHTVGNVTLLAGLVERGLAVADHDALDVRTYKLTFDGRVLAERLRDVIRASKDRLVTGDWDLDRF